jgi:hypothetical protein
MKRLTLHRIASSLHRFIASGAQLCLPLPGKGVEWFGLIGPTQ